ncbi:MAG: HAMP domain-containing sensor histidine kinase, partial [Treponema sp.]|nr:HAMP domain-containing sensor histidine kinase [Treponema sp.]
EVEKKLNHFKIEAIKNEKLARENEEKKDELIVYLAHDIKTPLTSMIGYLSLLSEIKDMPEEQRNKYIDITLDKSYRLEDLINELFDVARFNSEKIILEKEELNLNLMLEQIIDDFYPVLKELNKKIKFTPKEEIKLYGDPDKLSRVFNNLIKNAINYSSDDSNIDISAIKDEKNAIIKITNKGKQIPKEKLDRIFEKFYRLDSSRTSKTGGSGLGLAIAKEIIELHHGKITASSTLKETNFTVILPIDKP